MSTSKSDRSKKSVLAPSVARRLFMPMLLVTFLIVISWCVLTYDYIDRQNRNLIEQTYKTSELALDNHLLSRRHFIKGALEAVLSKKEYANPILRGSHEDILKIGAHDFELMKNEYGITHFYVMDTNRVILARMHHPTSYGDVNNRYGMLEAEKNGILGSGLDVGSYGSLTLRVVVPYRLDNKIIGYMEMGMELGSMLTDFHNKIGMDFAVLIDKSLVSAENWGKGLGVLHWEFPYNTFDNIVVTSQSFGIFPKSLAKHLLKSPATGMVSNLYFCKNWNIYLATPISLENGSNEHVGSLLVIIDCTSQFIQGALFCSGGIFIIFLAGFLIFSAIHRVTKRLDQRIARAMEYQASASADLERIAFVALYQMQAPLESINQNGRFLLEKTELKSTQRYSADKILEGTQSLQAIVGGIEDYFDLKLLSNSKKEVDLNAVLYEALERLRHRLRDVQVHASRLPTIDGHPLLLARLFFGIIEYLVLEHGIAKLEIRAEADNSKMPIVFSATTGVASSDVSDDFGPHLNIDTLEVIAETHGGGLQCLYVSEGLLEITAFL